MVQITHCQMAFCIVTPLAIILSWFYVITCSFSTFSKNLIFRLSTKIIFLETLATVSILLSILSGVSHFDFITKNSWSCTAIGFIFNYSFLCNLILSTGIAKNLDILRKPDVSIFKISASLKKTFCFSLFFAFLVGVFSVIERFYLMEDVSKDLNTIDNCEFKSGLVFSFVEVLSSLFAFFYFLYFLCDTFFKLRKANKREKPKKLTTRLLYPNTIVNQTHRRILRASFLYFLVFFTGTAPFVLMNGFNFCIIFLKNKMKDLEGLHVLLEKAFLFIYLLHILPLVLIRFHMFGIRLLLKNLFKKIKYKKERKAPETPGSAHYSLTFQETKEPVLNLSMVEGTGKRLTTINYFTSPSQIFSEGVSNEEYLLGKQKFMGEIQKTLVVKMSKSKLQYLSGAVWNTISASSASSKPPKTHQPPESKWLFPLSSYLDYKLVEISTNIPRIESKMEENALAQMEKIQKEFMEEAVFQSKRETVREPFPKERSRFVSLVDPERIGISYASVPFKDLMDLYNLHPVCDVMKCPLDPGSDSFSLKDYPNLGDKLSNGFWPRNTNYNMKFISKHIKKYLIEKFLLEYHKYMRTKGENTYLEKLCGLFSIQSTSNKFTSILLAFNPEISKCCMMYVVSFDNVFKVIKPKKPEDPFEFQTVNSSKEISDIHFTGSSRKIFEKILHSDLDFLSNLYLSFYSIVMVVYHRRSVIGFETEGNNYLKTVSRRYLVKPIIINYFSNHILSVFNPDSWLDAEHNVNQAMSISDPELYKYNMIQQCINYFY